mmetsp:Transcript_809/g.2100  ORF Transcript_809/g.2100 Transcript_809/m.2100 type:complete len:276 (-) Transcript_809:99-926(-)
MTASVAYLLALACSDVWDPTRGAPGSVFDPSTDRGGTSCEVLGGLNVSTIDAAIGLRYVHSFLSDEESQQLAQICEDNPARWARSRTDASRRAHDPSDNAHRTSESCALLFALFYNTKREILAARQPALLPELDLSWAITQRAAALLDVDIRRVEPIQVVRYAPGAEYRVHHDDARWMNAASAAERRSMTLLVYLPPADECSGSTHFPMLDPPVRVRPRVGDAIFWSNVDASGSPNALALHAGLPSSGSATGEKRVGNIWVAEEPFTSMPKQPRR